MDACVKKVIPNYNETAPPIMDATGSRIAPRRGLTDAIALPKKAGELELLVTLAQRQRPLPPKARRLCLSPVIIEPDRMLTHRQSRTHGGIRMNVSGMRMRSEGGDEAAACAAQASETEAAADMRPLTVDAN